MDQPILNPSIPYIGSIGDKENFFPHRLIRIQGTIPKVSFNINLQCGPKQFVQDIALQISVNISGQSISLKSTRPQDMNAEILESVDSIYNSIPGEKFEIVVLCQLDHYKIIFDGQQFCKFPHKIPFDRVSHLSIDGDVFITLISFEAEGGYEFRPISRRLLSSPVNEREHIEPLLLPNNVNSNSLLPPPYETIIKNNSENVKLTPVQEMHTEHVTVHRPQPLQFIRINTTSRPAVSNNFLCRILLSVLALLVFIILSIIKKTKYEDSSSTSFRIRRLG